MKQKYTFTYSRTFPVVDFPVHIERDVLKESNVLEMHSHSYYELAVVQEGRGFHIVDNDVYPISAGNIFFIRPHQKHRFVDIEHLTILNILFNIKTLEQYEWDINNVTNFRKLFYNINKDKKAGENLISFSIDEITLSKIVFIADEIINEINKQKSGYKFAVVTGFLNLIILISRNCKPDPGKFYNHNYQVSTLLGYIDKNYYKSITLQKLASISKMSVSTMRRRFSAAIGYSPIAYIQRVRIEKSALLLVGTDMPITQIAYKSGFKDCSYFSNQFKLLTSFTPRIYRKNRVNTFKAKANNSK